MNKQIKFGIILQYAQMALAIVIQLIFTPVMIRVLGNSEYGIYSLASSVISYLSLFSLGFGASYVRFYTKYKAQDDPQAVRRLNALYLSVFSLMGLAALAAGLVIAQNVGIFFNETYTVGDMQTAHTLMIFLSVNLAISFPASVFGSYITAQERFIFQKILNMGKTVMSPCLCIAVLFLGYGSIGMVVVTTALALLIDAINVFYCVGKLGMRFSFGRPDWRLLSDIAAFSVFIAISQIVDQINWQTDKVILGKVVNAAAVAVYTVAATVNTLYCNFSTAVSGVFAPRVNRIVVENAPDADEQLTTLFIRVGRVQFYIMTLILSGFVFFGRYFILRWAGYDYGDAYYVTLLLIGSATIPLIQNVGIEIQRAKNKHQFRSIVYLLMALLNVGISIWFCYLWGVLGVAVGTAVSLVLANGLVMNIYYQKALGIHVIRFWKSIAAILPAMIVPVSFGTVMTIFYDFRSLTDFALLIVAYTAVYVLSVCLLGFDKEEKRLVFGRFKKGKNHDSDLG